MTESNPTARLQPTFTRTAMSSLNPLADSFSPSVPLPSPTHPSALRVLFLNIRSLRNKLNDILLLTQQLNAPDIVCVNETWLDATVSDQEIALTGYSVTRRDRSGRVGGGVCIYWKSCLPVKPRDDITTDGVESCWCEVACKPRSCLVGTIYRPPSEPVGYWDKLDEHLCAALRPQPNGIVCGDFNVNIDLSARDPQYHYLSDLLNSYALHHGVNKSTRFSSTGQDSTLDLIILILPLQRRSSRSLSVTMLPWPVAFTSLCLVDLTPHVYSATITG